MVQYNASNDSGKSRTTTTTTVPKLKSLQVPEDCKAFLSAAYNYHRRIDMHKTTKKGNVEC